MSGRFRPGFVHGLFGAGRRPNSADMSHTDLPPEMADPAAPPDLGPGTPEDVMAAATARIAELEAERDDFRDR